MHADQRTDDFESPMKKLGLSTNAIRLDFRLDLRLGDFLRAANTNGSSTGKADSFLSQRFQRIGKAFGVRPFTTTERL